MVLLFILTFAVLSVFTPPSLAASASSMPTLLARISSAGIPSPLILGRAALSPLPERPSYSHRFFPGDPRLREVAKIVISLSQQRLYVLNANDEALAVWPISSGMKGYETPTGNFRIVNRIRRAYSEKYDAWMVPWMAIVRSGEYGIHGLEDRSYYRKLGRPASHGCIRLSQENAFKLMAWVKVGTPVKIVDVSVSYPSFEEAEQQREEDFARAYLARFTGYEF